MIPFILQGDAYTVSSNGFASSAAKVCSIYNYTNRYGAKRGFPDLAKDNRMVFWGLNHFVDNYLSEPITMEDILRSEHFMSNRHSFGGPLHFPKALWLRVLHEYNGFLPITIVGLTEGRTFFQNEPVVVVRSEEGFGELAAHIEARLVPAVAIGSGVATLCRHWLERMREQVVIDLALLGNANPTQDEVDGIARFQIHNFGARACSSAEESVLTGMGHLLSFHGTDNFDAAYCAWEGGAQHPTGTSIHALAHRNVLGYLSEDEAFQAIADSDEGNVKIVSCVADTYRYNNAVEAIVELARKDPKTIYVVRPDSGDCFETIKAVYEVCKAKGVNKAKNGYLLPANVRFIYGDSVKPERQLAVMAQLREHGMLPTQWGIWGVGGYIRNTCTRDTLSSAMKLAQVNQDDWRIDNGRPVVKLSETPSKMSVPFHTGLRDRFPRPYLVNMYDKPEAAARRVDETYYEPFGRIHPKMFSNAQHLAIHDFARLGAELDLIDCPDFGDKREDVLPYEIVKQQDIEFQKYRADF